MMYGTPCSATIDWCAVTTADEKPPVRISTLSSVIILVTAFCPPSRVDSSSPWTSSMVTFFPRLLTKTPPFALISSAASWADCQTSLPVVDAGPVMEATTPSLRLPGDACAWVQPAKQAETTSRPTMAAISTAFIPLPQVLCYSMTRVAI